jgi:hypothetical protein
MSQLSRKFELVQALDALIGGVVQDAPSAGTLVEGYFLSLRGTAAAAAPIDEIADLGQFIMRSSAGASLVSEQNFGFVAERTRRMFGSTAWQNDPAAIGDPIALHFYHSFDLTGTHGNVYPVNHGDNIEIMVPAVDAGVVEAGTVWEVHRVSVDRGDAFYLPRFHGRALDLAELRYEFKGKTAMIQFQNASVLDPERVSIFDGSGVRLLFSPWVDALGITNIFARYDVNEAQQVVYQHFSDNRESVIKCFGMDSFAVEMIGGDGFMQASHCVVEPMPTPARALASNASGATRMAQAAQIARVGGSQAVGAASALATPSITPGFASGSSTPATAPRDAIPTLKNTPQAVSTRPGVLNTISNWKR